MLREPRDGDVEAGDGSFKDDQGIVQTIELDIRYHSGEPAVLRHEERHW